MNFKQLNDIIENFCDSYDFKPYDEPNFNYEEQFVIYDTPNSFLYFLKNKASNNNRFTGFLIQLTEKRILNRKEQLIVSTLKNIERSIKQKDDLSNLLYTIKNDAERENIKVGYISLTDSIEHISQELNSLIEDLEKNNSALEKEFTKISELSNVQKTNKEIKLAS